MSKIYLFRPPSPPSLRFLFIGQFQNWCNDTLSFLPTSEIRDAWLLEPDQISHTHNLVAEREAAQILKMLFKTQHGSISSNFGKTKGN